jgi:hypothetical protein
MSRQPKQRHGAALIVAGAAAAGVALGIPAAALAATINTDPTITSVSKDIAAYTKDVKITVAGANLSAVKFVDLGSDPACQDLAATVADTGKSLTATTPAAHAAVPEVPEVPGVPAVVDDNDTPNDTSDDIITTPAVPAIPAVPAKPATQDGCKPTASGTETVRLKKAKGSNAADLLVKKEGS